MKNLLSLIAALVLGIIGSGSSMAESMRVMTYNIRYLNQNDGPDHWDARAQAVAAQIGEADIIGLQEATKPQIEDILRHRPEFQWYGVGRSDGASAGEFTPILWRSDRFEGVDRGTFWLGPDPTAIGQPAWGANLPRISSWVLLVDRRTSERLLVMNAHFDHQSEEARRKSAALIRRKASEIGGEVPVLFMGDLNAGPDSEPLRILTDPEGEGMAFTDSIRAPGITPQGPTGTWNGFHQIEPAKRIDFILLGDQKPIVEEHRTLDPKTEAGRFASDHLPVVVQLNLESSPAVPAEATGAVTAKPNIVVIFIDDMGYADIGPFGAKAYATPNLDRMAAEGMRFTDFVTSSAVCSASRAALLTGCYHRRVGIAGALGPDASVGINPEETTLAELCRSQGYATACFGKWHLGHHPKFLPTAHGFDHYFGLPYSNDMWPHHPANVARLENDPNATPIYPPLPLIEDDRVVDAEVTAEDQMQLTKQYTEHAVQFIEQNAKRPFFLYLPHSMVHVPIFASPEFQGKSGAGPFGDVVMEVDWSVGRVLEALKDSGIDDSTLVIFTSDNGPWLSYGEHAGSAGPLREGKGTMFEGGYRVPTLMRWPGKIPAGTTCDELASTIDILPTVAALIDAPLPERKIDGEDIRPLMFGEPGARSPHEAFYCYFAGGQLQAVRDRQWKLVFAHPYRTLGGRAGGRGGLPVPYETAMAQPALYDLKSDPGETTDVSAGHPNEVARLEQSAEVARESLGDRLRDRKGPEIRPAGRFDADGARPGK